MKRFFTRMTRGGGVTAFFAAVSLVFALAACPNPSGDPEQHTITFDSHEGSAVAAITANAGTAVPKPEDPTRSGHTFAGWFNAASGGTLYTWPHTLNADVTMHAQWLIEGETPPAKLIITFNSHEGSAVADVTADMGTAVTKPEDPVKAGYVFTGWFDAESGGILYTWPYTLNASVTMHARWRAEGETPPARHTIAFESHDGSAVEAVTADEGTVVSKPADPARSGYTFQGWFDAATGGTAYTWPHTLNADVTMHARWLIEGAAPTTRHTIAFDPQGGSAVAAITANAGTEVAKPEDPTRSGYTFAGWFNAASGGTAYTWPHTLNADVTMYARWTATPYTIAYNLDGGTNAAGNPATYTIESAEITLAAPARSGYTFGGWFDNSGFTGDEVTAIPPGSAGNKTFWARWSQGTVDRIEYYWVDEHDDLASTGDASTTLAKPATLTFTALPGSDGYSDWTWYLNGQPVPGTADTYTFESAGKDITNYYVGIRVKKGGKYYYTEITVTVTD